MAGYRNIDPEVGKATQFKPGVAPNPKGRPKGLKHISTWIQELLNDEEFEALIPDPREGWKQYKGAPLKAITRVMAIKAAGGDVKAFDALAKHGWTQKLELEHSGEITHKYEELTDEELDRIIEARKG
jgi:hypothetical protein